MKAKLEYILFIAGEPVSIRKIMSMLQLKKQEVLGLVAEINRDYEQSEKGFYIQEFSDHLQFATNERYRDLTQAYFKESKTALLGKSTIEVLATIAYRQPITKAEIDQLRGVKSDYSIKVLLDRDLIEVCGVLKAPGKPRLYQTTVRFLRNFGLHSIDDLEKVESE